MNEDLNKTIIMRKSIVHQPEPEPEHEHENEH